MNKIILVMLVLASTGCLSYSKAVRKCEAYCQPNKVRSVEYNYSTNRYDFCICTVEEKK